MEGHLPAHAFLRFSSCDHYPEMSSIDCRQDTLRTHTVDGRRGSGGQAVRTSGRGSSMYQYCAIMDQLCDQPCWKPYTTTTAPT